jgi:choline dehydrogenase
MREIATIDSELRWWLFAVWLASGVGPLPSIAAALRLRLVETDYIVVGTGSAGSVVASRLTADPAVRVVVLEAGPWDNNKFIHIPVTWVVKLLRSEVDWDYLTEPQEELNGRQIYWPQGKVLGGSSSINAMVWTRGFAADYDEWGALAGKAWDFAQVLEYYERIERGPLVISRQRSPRSSTAVWLKAAEQCGTGSSSRISPALTAFAKPS